MWISRNTRKAIDEPHWEPRFASRVVWQAVLATAILSVIGAIVVMVWRAGGI